MSLTQNELANLHADKKAKNKIGIIKPCLHAYSTEMAVVIFISHYHA